MVQFTRSSLPAAVSRKTTGSPQASGQRDPPRARPGPRATPAPRGLRGDRHSRLLGHVFCTDLGLAPQSRLLAGRRCGGSMPRALGPPVPPAGSVSRSFQGVNQQVRFQNQDSAAPILPLLFLPRPLPAAAESLPGHIVPRPSRQTAALPPRAPAEAGDGFSAPVTRGRTRQGLAGG